MNNTDWKMFKVFLSIFHYCLQKKTFVRFQYSLKIARDLINSLTYGAT